MATVAAILLLSSPASATYPGANGKIAFRAQNTPDILSINFDGTGVTNLTPGPGTNRMFRWSPDGTKLALISDGDGLDNFYDLYKINADGSGLVKLSSVGGAGGLDWSPDGSKLVFLDGGAQGREPGTLWTVNANGSGQTQIGFRDQPSDPPYGAPAWSPDATKIAVEKNLDGSNSEIYTINPDGTGETRLTNNPFLDTRPAWSPDGRRIAFTTGEFSCCRTVYVMNADGSDQRRLTDDSEVNVAPEWSPDGSKIAFLSLRDDPFNYEIYTVNVDGTDVRRVTVSANSERFHTWAPDSSAIAFQRFDQGRERINVINADGTMERSLADADGYPPDWQTLVRAAFKNESAFCRAQLVASGRAEFRERYRAFGHCVRQSRVR